MHVNIVFIVLFILSLIDLCGSKRSGGGGFPSSRGSSGGRMGGMHMGGGVNQGSRASSGGWNQQSSINHRVRQPNGNTGGTWGRGTFGRSHHAGSKLSFGSRIGSKLRSNQFKNAIVGAAAGYLTYQAGKAIIRSAFTPMMWGNRPYYWGSSYYRGGGSGSHMCRMPVSSNDDQFENVYFEGGAERPKEIVWSCNYYEYCCGYECCSRGGSYGGWGFGIGSLIVLILGLSCGFFICYKFLQKILNQCIRTHKPVPYEAPPPY